MPTIRVKKYVCGECGKAYNRPALLRQHERTHSNDRPFTCTYEGCDKAFFRKSHAQVHELLHKSDSEKPYQCTVCGKGTITPQLLRRHELTHTKSHKCNYEGCTEAFYRYQSLKHHVDMVHKQVLTCEHCNRRFQLPSLLASHKLKNHGEAEVLQCDHAGCFTTFKDKYSLKNHCKEVHPVHICPECKASVVGVDAFNLHMKTHENLSLWKCELCTVQLVSKAELIKHYQDIHNGKLPADILCVHDRDELNEFLKQAKAQSLTSIEREEQQVKLEESEPKSTDAKKVVEHAVPDKPMIELVLGNSQNTYVCPKKKCGKKFIRRHAYEKHLKWHEIHLAKIEEFLQKLEQDGATGDGSRVPADTFSDFSDYDSD